MAMVLALDSQRKGRNAPSIWLTDYGRPME